MANGPQFKHLASLYNYSIRIRIQQLFFCTENYYLCEVSQKKQIKCLAETGGKEPFFLLFKARSEEAAEMLNTKAKLAEEEAMLLTQKTSDKEMEIHRVKMAAIKVKN